MLTWEGLLFDHGGFARSNLSWITVTHNARRKGVVQGCSLVDHCPESHDPNEHITWESSLWCQHVLFEHDMDDFGQSQYAQEQGEPKDQSMMQKRKQSKGGGTWFRGGRGDIQRSPMSLLLSLASEPSQRLCWWCIGTTVKWWFQLKSPHGTWSTFCGHNTLPTCFLRLFEVLQGISLNGKSRTKFRALGNESTLEPSSPEENSSARFIPASCAWRTAIRQGGAHILIPPNKITHLSMGDSGKDSTAAGVNATSCVKTHELGRKGTPDQHGACCTSSVATQGFCWWWHISWHTQDQHQRSAVSPK